jgi:hypothetical protein
MLTLSLERRMQTTELEMKTEVTALERTTYTTLRGSCSQEDCR